MVPTYIRELFSKDPVALKIPNDGVVAVAQLDSLRFELETFVCTGEYARGLERILSSYNQHVGDSDQPAVWVSGFFGSGKSHIVKMLRYLWVDYSLPDGSTARGLANLPAEIQAQLRELTTHGNRVGGLFATAGKLEQQFPLLRGILAIVLEGLGLPKDYDTARFTIWLQEQGILQNVQDKVAKQGKDYANELRHMYVSPILADSIIQSLPNWADTTSTALSRIQQQFSSPNTDIGGDEFIAMIAQVLKAKDGITCTLIVLDELQQYIGTDPGRAYAVQLVTESCCKNFRGRLLFVGTGQSALTGTPSIERLQARFTIPIHLSDKDVAVVTRELVLQKKPTANQAISDLVKKASGEIDRHLRESKIGPKPEDARDIIADYPILPVRRRFWESALRALDRAGVHGQLRNQLQVILGAVKSVAEKPIGAIVSADFIYEQIYPKLLEAGVLSKDINTTILQRRDGTPAGELQYRLAALIYLIGETKNIGIRATPEILADLLVDDLSGSSSSLREQIPVQLKVLVEDGHIQPIENYYLIQTPEGASWNADYRANLNRVSSDESRIELRRRELLQEKCKETLSILHVTQGKTREPRQFELHYSKDAPPVNSSKIYIWIRDQWTEADRVVRDDAHKAGQDSPVVFVYLPWGNWKDTLKAKLTSYLAARDTIDTRGNQTTDEGKAARKSMETQMQQWLEEVHDCLRHILVDAIVFQGGGNEIKDGSFVESVKRAIESALTRQFNKFPTADDPLWSRVKERALRGDAAALSHMGYTGDPASQAVCKDLLATIGAGMKGSEIRTFYRDTPYGWPQDAIDGALAVLVANDLVEAHQGNRRYGITELTAQNLGKIDFRVVTIQFTIEQKISVRKILQEAGLSHQPGKELSMLPELLATIETLAKNAGGDAPCPKQPTTTYLEPVRRATGNEQGVELAKFKDQLIGDIQEWKRRGDLIRERLPRWTLLKELATHGQDLYGMDDIADQMSAIVRDRALIDDPDPTSPLLTQVSALLRQAILDVHKSYMASYEGFRVQLESDPTWRQLTESQRKDVLSSSSFTPLSSPDLGSPEKIASALKARPLSDLRTRTDALPGRFSSLREKAVTLNTPQAVKIQVPPATIRSSAEIDPYLSNLRSLIQEQLDKGKPVIL